MKDSCRAKHVRKLDSFATSNTSSLPLWDPRVYLDDRDVAAVSEICCHQEVSVSVRAQVTASFSRLANSRLVNVR